MYEKLEKYKCGGCGNDQYEIFKEQDSQTRLITECTQCGSQTEIIVTQPKIEIKWGESGSGIMAIF